MSVTGYESKTFVALVILVCVVGNLVVAGPVGLVYVSLCHDFDQGIVFNNSNFQISSRDEGLLAGRLVLSYSTIQANRNFIKYQGQVLIQRSVKFLDRAARGKLSSSLRYRDHACPPNAWSSTRKCESSLRAFCRTPARVRLSNNFIPMYVKDTEIARWAFQVFIEFQDHPHDLFAALNSPDWPKKSRRHLTTSGMRPNSNNFLN